jgi:hypothetical protein
MSKALNDRSRLQDVLVTASKFGIPTYGKSKQLIIKDVKANMLAVWAGKMEIRELHFKQLPLKINRITGLKSFELMSLDDNLVYLAGEIHKLEDICEDCFFPEGCVDVTALTYSLADYASSQVGVYQEYEFDAADQESDDESDYHDNTISSMLSAFSENHKKLRYDLKNIKFHDVDLRPTSYSAPINIIATFAQKYCLGKKFPRAVLEIMEYLMKENRIKTAVKDEIDIVMTASPVEVISLLEQTFYYTFMKQRFSYDISNVPVASKEIMKLPVNVREQLHHFFIQRYYTPLLDAKELADYCNPLLQFSLFHMDVYALAVFLNTPDELVKIVYAGNAHIDVYHAFLSYIGYKSHFRLLSQDDDLCLSMSREKLLYI